MKWFKHLSASFHDPDIMESELQFGAKGPHIFWRTLEILSAEDAVDKPLAVNFKVFKQWIPSCKPSTIKLVLDWYALRKRLQISYQEESITIFCPKLSDISSDYSRKVRSHSGVTLENIPPRLRSRSRRKTKKENTITKPPKCSPEQVRLKGEIFAYFSKKYLEVRGVEYRFDGSKDGKAIKMLLALDLPLEIYRRAIDNGFNQSTYHAEHMTLLYLANKFNQLQGTLPKKERDMF